VNTEKATGHKVVWGKFRNKRQGSIKKTSIYVTYSYYQAIFIKVLLGMVSFRVVKREMEDAFSMAIWQIGNMVFRIDSHAFRYERIEIRHWQASLQHGHMADREHGYSN
jgi:hypothetical protein